MEGGWLGDVQKRQRGKSFLKGAKERKESLVFWLTKIAGGREAFVLVTGGQKKEIAREGE